MLSNITFERAKPRSKPYKLTDGDGLHLLISPNGSKLWRVRYVFSGKETMLSLGSYPIVTLVAARAKRDEMWRLLADGINPSMKRRAEKIASSSENSFEAIAKEYLTTLPAIGRAPITVEKTRWLLLDIAKPLAMRPITHIKPIEILDLLKKVETSGRRDTAHRLKSAISRVFRYAIANLKAENDPTYALRGSLLRVITKHRAAITDEKTLGALMKCIDEYDGWPQLRHALLLLPLTMTRPGEVRHMQRSEIDFAKKLWRIPAERMKMRRPFEVPLSRQALKVLKEAWPLNTDSELVFPSLRSHRKPMSENAFNSALRRMGFTQEEMTAHGFRSAASTILNERGFDERVIEAALAHLDPNEVRRTYNRAAYLAERTTLMQAWADLLDDFRRVRTLRVVA